MRKYNQSENYSKTKSLLPRVRRHFRFEAKWNKTEAKFFASMRKKCFFACVASMRNIEIWNETKMERSENKTKKKRKTAIIFASKRNEAKRKRKTAIIFALKWNKAIWKQKTAIIFASKRNEAKRKRNFFRFDAKKVSFCLLSHLKRNENEMKQKQNEKEANEKILEAKQSENTLY